MLGADLAQALQIADRRHDHAGGAGERFDDHRGDRRGVAQRDDAVELFRQLRPLLRHAARKGVAGQQGVRQVVRLGAGAERLAVAGDAADRDTAEVNAVVALFPADKAGFARLAFGAPVSARHFQRCVRRFRAGAGEEHVIQPRRRQRFDFVG